MAVFVSDCDLAHIPSGSVPQKIGKARGRILVDPQLLRRFLLMRR